MASKRNKKHKYIFVVGGVMSGVGKGISVSSIGLILESKGYKVNLCKVDPYLNVDAGTMNPTEHGEVFVMDSGLETDQDMGNYERFLNRDLRTEDYMTSGMVYKTVIENERALKYGGRCVEAIPDVRNEIIRRFELSAEVNETDITVIEIGGTVGDFQNELFIEASRVMKIKNPKDVIFVMVSYLPVPGKLGEMKSKPTQTALRQLNNYGVQADFIIARSEVEIDQKRKEKIANSCLVKVENIISAPDCDSIYDIPLNFEKDDIGNQILRELDLPTKPSHLADWQKFVEKSKTVKREVKIAIVGKYFDSGDFVLSDSYLSVIESLKFSAYHLGVRPKISWLSAKEFEKNSGLLNTLKDYDGILVPGGFGETGIEGKLAVIKFARENKIPYLGLCYGMQLLVIEFARNVLGWKDANTAEINPKAQKIVIDILPEQKEKIAKGDMGGSMRLGAYRAILKKGSIAEKAYGQKEIDERHRHRYEVNPVYVADLEKAGLVFSGSSEDGVLKEIAELPQSVHPFMLGTQFHPEFHGRPLAPQPIFTAFLKKSLV